MRVTNDSEPCRIKVIFFDWSEKREVIVWKVDWKLETDGVIKRTFYALLEELHITKKESHTRKINDMIALAHARKIAIDLWHIKKHKK